MSVCYYFFFFKQKTAYEMRISDWSSDVCSSDLLDLKTPEGKAIAQKLASEADVVVESFRPGVMGRFGLGYEDVKKTNPKVVYLSVTGFGQSGPNSKLPTTDSVIQAYSGWMTLHRDSEGSSDESRVGKGCVRTCRTRGVAE